MTALARIVRRFGASTHGLAAVEFAMVVPVLLILFLATFDAGRAIAAYMKVRAATFTLASITNQYSTSNNGIATADMTAITGASAKVLAPFTGTTVVKITQIKATTLTAATVSWSYALNGTAYTQGNGWTLPTNFTGTGSGKGSACNSYPCYYVYAEVSYTYSPVFGKFLTGPIALGDTAYVTPRSSPCIQYNNVPATC